MSKSFLISFGAVFFGGGSGAVLRWLLSLKLNSNWPSVQIGTLAANLSGAFIIGLSMAFLTYKSDLPPEVRLFGITGLLGGLTTFSTFSAEVVQLLAKGQLVSALGTVAGNLLGSLLLTALGLTLGRFLLSR